MDKDELDDQTALYGTNTNLAVWTACAHDRTNKEHKGPGSGELHAVCVASNCRLFPKVRRARTGLKVSKANSGVRIV